MGMPVIGTYELILHDVNAPSGGSETTNCSYQDASFTLYIAFSEAE